LVVDASLTGLGAVLLQRSSPNESFKPVIFKSRSLKDPETRYSATEREALAIRWAIKKLRKYLIGGPKFKVVTDHKPLTYMFHRQSGDLPPRVEKFVMDVQEYESCHVINEHSAVTIEKVIKAAAECPLMQQLKQAIENREEGDEQLKPFMSREIRHDLNITNGLICRGKRLIIPPPLYNRKLFGYVMKDTKA